MKKFLVTVSIIAAFAFNANAQSDSFFSYSNVENQDRNQSLLAMPAYGQTDHQSAPIGSGLLLLAGMGVAYAMRKRD